MSVSKTGTRGDEPHEHTDNHLHWRPRSTHRDVWNRPVQSLTGAKFRSWEKLPDDVQRPLFREVGTAPNDVPFPFTQL